MSLQRALKRKKAPKGFRRLQLGLQNSEKHRKVAEQVVIEDLEEKAPEKFTAIRIEPQNDRNASSVFSSLDSLIFEDAY